MTKKNYYATPGGETDVYRLPSGAEAHDLCPTANAHGLQSYAVEHQPQVGGLGIQL